MEHQRRDVPLDKDFLPDAIKTCNEKEVWSKADLGGADLLDRLITDKESASNSSPHLSNFSIAFPEERTDVPAHLLEFSVFLDGGVTSQIKFHRNLTSGASLTTELTLISGEYGPWGLDPGSPWAQNSEQVQDSPECLTDAILPN